jgi:hypothetical protein
MLTLQRLTTRYDPAEDRLCLCGLDASGQTVSLWLTQRLLVRLVPVLCQALEAPTPPERAAKGGSRGGVEPLRAHLEQSFAQQKARAALPKQPPVTASPSSPFWRVDAVDIQRSAGAVRLLFKGSLASEQAELALPLTALRQWLGIVYGQCRQAAWPLQAWPDWMEEGAVAPAAGQPALALH